MRAQLKWFKHETESLYHRFERRYGIYRCVKCWMTSAEINQLKQFYCYPI